MSGILDVQPAFAGIALLVKLAMRAAGGDHARSLADNMPFGQKAVLMRTARDMGVPPGSRVRACVDAWEAVSRRRVRDADARRGHEGAQRRRLTGASPVSSRRVGLARA